MAEKNTPGRNADKSAHEHAVNEREIALQILMKTDRGQGFSHENIKESLDRHPGLRPEERSFIKRLCEGTIERKIELDARVERFSKKKAKALRPLVRMILRMGIYQICYMDAIPDSAACNEAVKLVKKHHMGNLAGFVNAILRNTARAKKQDFQKTECPKGRDFQKTESAEERDFLEAEGIKEQDLRKTERAKEQILRETENDKKQALQKTKCPEEHDFQDVDCDPKEELRKPGTGAGKEPGSFVDTWLEAQPSEVRFSMPAWICDLWNTQFGKERTVSLMEALLAIRPVTIRVDERLDAEEWNRLVDEIRESGIAVQNGRWLPYAFLLTDVSDVTSIPGFSEGKITVQDESSMLVAEAAGLRGDENVLDVCAAPGGKSMHCASKLLKGTRGGGRVFAFDVSAKKADRIRKNARRMRLDNLEVSVRDASVPVPEDQHRADVLLCDLPCSGLGVMGRKRDIKYNVSPEGIASLTKLQRQILRACAGYVKPGGVLIYSTCTIDRAENEDMAAFIETLGFIPDELTPFLPEGMPGISGKNHHMLQLLPDEHGTDGFFIARFRKPGAGM